MPFPTSGNPSARFLAECVQNIATIKCKKRDGQGWILPFPINGSPSARFLRNAFKMLCILLVSTRCTKPKRLMRDALVFLVVGRGGFGPPKSVTADLQSAPFGRSGTYPYIYINLIINIWSWRLESNPQPADYKSAALPIELRQHYPIKKMVP